MSYEKKAEMGARGREHVAEVFDKRKVVELTIEEIER